VQGNTVNLISHGAMLRQYGGPCQPHYSHIEKLILHERKEVSFEGTLNAGKVERLAV